MITPTTVQAAPPGPTAPRALDLEALALHYRVPASTLRGWAKVDGWRRYPDPTTHGRRGRPRVLFDLGDADRSYWTRQHTNSRPHRQ